MVATEKAQARNPQAPKGEVPYTRDVRLGVQSSDEAAFLTCRS
jgi:hypothetical protein